MTASLRLKKCHWPTLRLVTSPARCKVARCAETVDWDSPQRWSNLPAQTPISKGWSCSTKYFSGSLSHCSISRLTGCASALMISSRSMDVLMAGFVYRDGANFISSKGDTGSFVTIVVIDTHDRSALG
ncbi:hypothetical protein D9M68_896140 [compost metagenome]